VSDAGRFRDELDALDTSSLGAVRSEPLRLVPTEEPRPEPLAFDDLFRAEFAYVRRTLRRFGVREEALDDVAQDVFVAVHARFAERDPSRPVKPWLVAFAYRFAANHVRLARHTNEPARDDAPSGDGSPEDAASDKESQALVIAALQRVRLERRPVLTMHDIDGFSLSEIARALEISPNTAASRLRLAREDFRAGVRVERRRRRVRR
jgi:RNA polymerase sigma-70 factor, ECF subfamily